MPPSPAAHPFAPTPEPPYYAVIFSSDRVAGDALDVEKARVSAQ